MKSIPAPCLGCTLTCPRRDNRRVSKRLREKCRREGGSLISPYDPSFPPLQISTTSAIDKTYPCEHRPDEPTGTAACGSCSGSVSLKVFKCGSPEVPQSLCVIGPKTPKGNYAACSNCLVRSVPGTVLRDQIVAGVTTAPRKKSTLQWTLQSLDEAGFKKILVFADGYRKEDFPTHDVHYDVTIRETTSGNKLGGWPNFYLGLQELYLTFPTAGLYAMFQDDVLACPGLAKYLLKHVDNSYPVWSPFQMEGYKLAKQGWNKVDAGFAFCGAQALVFTNEGVRMFLQDPEVVRYRRFPNIEAEKFRADGVTHIDSVVGRFARKGKKGVAVHHPSLLSHIGETSVMHGSAGLENRWRSEKRWLGETYDLSKPPHVGCMMVSGGSPDRKRFIRFAIEDFLKQDYKGTASLMIFDYHEESIREADGIGELLERHYLKTGWSIGWRKCEPKTLGAQRQELLSYFLLEEPEARLLLQWDDDDRVPVDYLSYRVKTCPPGAASILTRQTFFYEDGRPDDRIDFNKDPKKFPGFPGTIMFPACFADEVRYPDQQYREDTIFMHEMAKRTTLVRLQNDFDMYYRRCHGNNILGDAHFRDLSARLGQ